MKSHKIAIFSIFLILFNFPVFAAVSALDETTSKTADPNFKPPTTIEMSIEAKRSSRKKILQQLIHKYNQNNTFAQMHQYMIAKYRDLGKDDALEPPEQLITTTLDKSRSVFEKTKSFVGNNFKRQYNPVLLEESIKKYLWLKGICFLILGIKEEHKIAISYFYAPGNEAVKKSFMIDTVKYSYPEVRDIPENADWFETMGELMERLGYKLFNVENY